MGRGPMASHCWSMLLDVDRCNVVTTLCAGTRATTPGWSTSRAACRSSPSAGTATDELTGRVGRPPIVAEQARHLGVGDEEVLDARGAGGPQPALAGRADL
jgi:hypothetical protein